MEGELTILTPIVQYIFAGLSAVLLLLLFGSLFWIIKRLFRERDNDFKHIKQKLGELPCDTHTEQLRQMEKRINAQS